jgi:hypothetical protein
MTILALRAKLQSMGIRDDSYSLDRDQDERYVLKRDGSHWVVYYSERGLRTGLQIFDSFDAAAAHLCEELTSDALARQADPVP